MTTQVKPYIIPGLKVITREIMLDYAKQLSKSSIKIKAGTMIGACVESDGVLFGGFVVEQTFRINDIHAEQAAILSMLLHGKEKFSRIAVYSNRPEVLTPCASCLTWISQFGEHDVSICIANIMIDRVFHLTELLPFGPS